MDLRVLLHGGSFRISEDRWRHARSCLRDPRGLAQAVQQLETHLERQAPGDGAEPAGRHRLRRGGAPPRCRQSLTAPPTGVLPRVARGGGGAAPDGDAVQTGRHSGFPDRVRRMEEIAVVRERRVRKADLASPPSGAAARAWWRTDDRAPARDPVGRATRMGGRHRGKRVVAGRRLIDEVIGRIGPPCADLAGVHAGLDRAPGGGAGPQRVLSPAAGAPCQVARFVDRSRLVSLVLTPSNWRIRARTLSSASRVSVAISTIRSQRPAVEWIARTSGRP